MAIQYRRAADLTVSRRHGAVGVEPKAGRRTLVFVAATLIAAAMLSWLAVLNGYPLIFGDSARYLNGGILRYLPSEAPIFYGVFMIPLHLNGFSLWPVVAAQCLVLAYVLGASLRALGLFEERSFVLLVAFLALFTTAPWFAVFIMPDIFAPICVLAMFALFRGWEKFSGLERVVLVGLALLALASHVTHIVVGLALAALFGALRLLGRPVSNATLLTVLPLPLVALGAVVGVNVIAKGRPAITQDGPVFLLARTFADGPAYDYMRTHCAERRWKVCERLEDLPRDGELFLWSPEKSVWSSTTWRAAARRSRGNRRRNAARAPHRAATCGDRQHAAAVGDVPRRSGLQALGGGRRRADVARSHPSFLPAGIRQSHAGTSATGSARRHGRELCLFGGRRTVGRGPAAAGAA